MVAKLGRLFLGAAVVTLILYAILALLARSVPERPFFAGDDGVLVIAHQGGNLVRPDNTLLAFEHAVALGVDVLEMDISGTSDGTLVVMHDLTVDRTTNGLGPITGMTLAEIQGLDAAYNWSIDDGATFPYRGRGVTVPALEEVFLAFPDMRMNIEIKQQEPSIVAPFCQLLRDHRMTDQVLVASFHPETMTEFRQACPEVATSAVEPEIRLFFALNMARLAAIYQAPAEAFQVPEYSGDLHVVTERFVRNAHRHNLDVHVWTVNEESAMQRLLDLGVDGIITDRPDLLLGLLGRDSGDGR